jgi:hypothetical protein
MIGSRISIEINMSRGPAPSVVVGLLRCAGAGGAEGGDAAGDDSAGDGPADSAGDEPADGVEDGSDGVLTGPIVCPRTPAPASGPVLLALVTTTGQPRSVRI